MNRYFILPFLFLTVGCNTEIEPEIVNEKVMELHVEGENFTFTNEEFSANENCEHIFISASDNGNFRIRIELKTSGHIKDIHFYDFSNHNAYYRTVDFNSSEVFFIKNYNFSPPNRTLSFDFSGMLLNMNNEKDRKIITGKINIDNLDNVSCSFQPRKITANINQSPYNMVDYIGRSTSSESNWLSISNDGFKISIITGEELSEMSKGIYPFSKNDSINIVKIEKYIGPYKVTPLKIFLEEEWESFQYEGELIIEEQISNHFAVTKGSFKIKASRNNEVVYDVIDGEFSL